MDLDEVADELYQAPPDQFTALRTQRQGQARADGDRTLAAAIGRLAKPSAAAWVCNLLVREHREEIEGLVELGELLRAAQEELAGEQLRALDRQRAQLLTVLTRQAASLAREHGRPVGSAVAGQVEQTLRTAMADPDAGEALLGGRLTAPMSYSGGLGAVGTRPDLRLVPPARPDREEPARPPAPAARRRAAAGGSAAEARETEARKKAEAARRAAEERHRRELAEARRAVEEADVLAGEARRVAEEERGRLEELGGRAEELQVRVAELRDELDRTEREAAGTAEELTRARRRRRTAEGAAARAEAARDEAAAALAELESRP